MKSSQVSSSIISTLYSSFKITIDKRSKVFLLFLIPSGSQNDPVVPLKEETVLILYIFPSLLNASTFLVVIPALVRFGSFFFATNLVGSILL